jgi:multidrug efflux pump subunit AcrA (membrane-fusion protein)
VIARLDTEAVDEHLSDVEDQVIQMGFTLRRIEAQQAVTAETYRQRVGIAKANLEKARLNERTAPIRNELDQEILRLAVEEARLQYKEAESQVALAGESMLSQRRLSQYSYDFQIRHRGRHRAELEHATIRSPIAGKVVLRAIMRHGEYSQVQIGDEVSPGQPFMRIMDLAELQVEGTISQTDSENIRLGQKAKVRFDAYPDLILEGRVDAVGAMAVSGRRVSYYVRRIPVRIAIESTEPRVIPDLTASADVVIGEDEGGLLIPRDTVQESGGKRLVFVKQGETISPREVEIGGFSSTQASVISGLQEGEQVVAVLSEKDK